MSAYDFIFNDITRTYRETNNLVPLTTLVGDADGNIVDAAIPGKIQVRYSQSGQLSMPFSVNAPRHKMSLAPGTPVELTLDRYGNMRIDGYDTVAMTAVGMSPLSQVVDTSKTRQQDMATLLPQPTQPATTTVLVKGWNPILDNSVTLFPGGSIDLGSSGENVIPGAGDQAWIVIALDSDFSTLVAFSSTVVSLFDLLDKDSAIQECLDQLSQYATPIWALLLSDDQATIQQQDFDAGEDMRQAINTAAGGGTTGNVSGPGTSTNRAIATWNGTDGRTLFDNPSATIDSSGNLVSVSLTANGTGGNGYLANVAQTSNPSAPAATGWRVFATSVGAFAWRVKNGTDTFTRAIVGTLTGDHNYTLQDANGTIALTGATGQGFVMLAPSTTADNTVTPTGAAIVPLTLNIPSGSSANIQEWKASAVVKASISSVGIATFTGTTGSRALILTTGGIGLDNAERIFMKDSGGTYRTAIASDSGNNWAFRSIGAAFAWQDINGNTLINLSAAGVTTIRTTTASTGVTQLIVRAGAGQATTDLIQIQDGSANILYSIHAYPSIASASGAVLRDFYAKAQTITISGSTNITTATGFNLIEIERPTLSAASALTISNAATLYIANSPLGGGAGPATISNPYAVWVDDGTTRLDGDTLSAGYLRVGATNVPTNTTAGDLTSIRLSIGNPALGASGRAIRAAFTNTATAAGADIMVGIEQTINPASNSSAEFRAISFENFITAATGITLNLVRGANFGNRARNDGLITALHGIISTAMITDSSSAATTQATTVIGIESRVYVRASGTTTSNITTGVAFGTDTITSGSGLTITDMIGFRMSNPGANTITNLIGVEVVALTRASALNIGVRIATPSGATDNYALQLSGTGGSAASGITFGTDVQLWRSAANTLKSDAKITLLGSDTVVSGASATYKGIEFRAATATLTGSTNVTTATGFNYIDIARPTYTAGSALTVDIGATVYIANSPLAAGSLALTTPLALWVDAGTTRLDGDVLVGGLTANRVTFATTSGKLTDSANLTYDGSTFSIFTKFDVNSSGIITKYNNIATEGYGVAAEVDVVNLTGQTADIGTTNCTNANVAGLYRVSAYLSDTTADVLAGAVILTFTWTDDVGSTTQTLTQVLTGTGRTEAIFLLYLASGNLTYATTHTGIIGTAAYAVRFVVERMN